MNIKWDGIVTNMNLFKNGLWVTNLQKFMQYTIKVVFALSLFVIFYSLSFIVDVTELKQLYGNNFTLILASFIFSSVLLSVIYSLQRKRRDKTWRKVNSNLEQLQSRVSELEVVSANDYGTGLPSRFKLLDFLEVRLAQESGNIAFCIIDLDDLRSINDTLGYKMGDEVIVVVAQRLKLLADKWQKTTPFSTYLCCLGSDEFVLLVMDVASEDELTPLLDELLVDVRRSIEFAQDKIYMTASVGVCVSPKDGASSESMLRKADMALFQVKKNGKNAFAFYQKKYLEELELRIKTECEISRALISNEFEVYYQPVIDTLTGAELGFEALIRWNHPTRGLVPPDEFIPVAEQTGIIVPLGEWVIKQVCSDLSILQIQNKNYFIAINIAPQQLEDRGFIQKIQAIITCYALRPEQIHFELTETTLMNATESNLRLLREINNLGIKLWIDDFGTGYSSFSYLHKFSFYGIKLDRSFIEHVVESERSQNIVRCICAMGDALKLALLAEGIEDSAQAEFLIGLGCHHVQGYWYARPMSISNLYLWLASRDENSAKVKNCRLKSG